MKIKQLTGYMLGNDNHVVMPGEQWCPNPSCVWICRNLNVARAVLRASHKNRIYDIPVWTTIYRVRARNIPHDRMDNDFIYTDAADKIFVDAVVHYQEPPRITERQLLENAQRIRASFMKTMHGTMNDSAKKER